MDNAILVALARLFLAGLISGIITQRTIPDVNRIARTKGLLNPPGERTSHRYLTPNLAGISIFLASTLTALFFIETEFETFKIIFLASTIIFFTGVKDDIVSLAPWKKLLAQTVAAVLLVALTDLRVTQTYHFFGLQQLDDITSTAVTVAAFILIINAVNLIDGIDGLAASIGCLILGTFGLFFFLNGMYCWSIYCMCMIGPLGVFFQYNVFGLRNKTFMGDSGSLLLGFSVAVTTILFWETNARVDLPLTFDYAPAIALAIIIIPVFDAIRVFIYRIWHHSSPFVADRNHLHHRFIDMGFSHFQTSILLIALNIIMIAIAIGLGAFTKMGMIWIALILISIMILFAYFISRVWEGRKEGRKEGSYNRLKFN